MIAVKGIGHLIVDDNEIASQLGGDEPVRITVICWMTRFPTARR
jgi:hypothetical protein